jgi:ABC-type transporter Mla maintaining outer membrane lipid asymmetry ATPase subunit MlaF
MRSIIGLQKPDAGVVEVLGENMIDRAEDEAKNIRRRWGILFQNGALFSTLTVAENVEVPIREYFPSRHLLDEIASYKIAMSGLPPMPSQIPVGALRGMRKRAGLCARWRSIPSCCSSTSRPPASTRSRRRVRRIDPLAAAAARADRLPDHPRSRHASAI